MHGTGRVKTGVRAMLSFHQGLFYKFCDNIYYNWITCSQVVSSKLNIWENWKWNTTNEFFKSKIGCVAVLQHF